MLCILRLALPALGATLAVGVTLHFLPSTGGDGAHANLNHLPWFAMRDWLTSDGLAFLLGTLPIALLGLGFVRKPDGGLRPMRIAIALAVSWWITCAWQGQPMAHWLGALAGGLLCLAALGVGPRDAPLSWRGWSLMALACGLWACVFWITGQRLRAARAPENRNVILIVLDTVAASHLAGYGYERVTTPELDSLAKRGMVFENSYSAAPWTLPSHASLFTGLYPISHGATQEHLHLDDSMVTLAERLKDGGYRTFGATNNAVISAKSNFHQGFQTYLQMPQTGREVKRPAEGQHPTNLVAQAFLDSLGGSERFFVFLNYIEAHSPYRPRRELAEPFLDQEWDRKTVSWAARQGWDHFYMDTEPLTEQQLGVLRGLYDGELAGLSRTIAELMQALASRDLLEETVIVITSDHGENIGDHGHMGHVFDLHDGLLRVPLMMLGGGLPEGVRRSDPTCSVDLYETILALAGLRAPNSQGRDLLADGAEKVGPLDLIAEYSYPAQVMSVLMDRGRGYENQFDRLEPYLRRMRSIRREGWKLIWGSDGNHALFNVAEDPGETTNLVEQEPERLRDLERRLLDRLGELTGSPLDVIATPFSETAPVRGFEDYDEETRKQLKALGYSD